MGSVCILAKLGSVWILQALPAHTRVKNALPGAVLRGAVRRSDGKVCLVARGVMCGAMFGVPLGVLRSLADDGDAPVTGSPTCGARRRSMDATRRLEMRRSRNSEERNSI